jgi:hypothetical protein
MFRKHIDPVRWFRPLSYTLPYLYLELKSREHLSRRALFMVRAGTAVLLVTVYTVGRNTWTKILRLLTKLSKRSTSVCLPLSTLISKPDSLRTPLNQLPRLAYSALEPDGPPAASSVQSDQAFALFGVELSCSHKCATSSATVKPYGIQCSL